jgi:peptidoglycan/LPS O-acetylase OafA/YrhL
LVSLLAKVSALSAGVINDNIGFATLFHMEPVAVGALWRWRRPASKMRKVVCFSRGGAVIGGLCSRFATRVEELVSCPSGGCCEFSGVDRVPRSHEQSRQLKPLIYLGKISYGLYVFHLLAIHLASTLESALRLVDRS